MVRNFWVEADIDGRETNANGGPRSKDGGMDVTIYQRDDGEIKTVLRIISRAYDGKLVTTVDANGERVAKIETKR